MALKGTKGQNYSFKHGIKKKMGYAGFHAAKARCYDKRNKRYAEYGGRGITMCDRWLDPVMGVINFFKDMGEKPSLQHSLDRIDVNGNYEPNNCRWATIKEQANNKRTNIILVKDGVSKTLSEWADFYEISFKTVRKRYYHGFDFDKIFAKNRHSTAKPKGMKPYSAGKKRSYREDGSFYFKPQNETLQSC